MLCHNNISDTTCNLGVLNFDFQTWEIGNKGVEGVGGRGPLVIRY